ncbi:MAG TPA: TraB/GumN family protein [Burkholderiales bacterium]|nr:TraB/GumN family protein [Burkholderiales bacterium]
MPGAARFLLAGLLLGWGVACADPGAALSRGLLWRIERPGGAPSHVFGTIHSADPRVKALSSAAEQVLDNSRSFTLEIQLDDVARQVFADAMFLDRGDLRGLIGEDGFQEAARRMQAAGIPPEVTNQLKPWAVLISLVVPDEAGGVILDHELLHRAMQQRKPVYQLETVMEQIALFDDIPLDIQVLLLSDALRRFDVLAGFSHRTLEAWLAQDLVGIWSASTALMEGAGPAARHQEYFIRRVINGRSVIMAHRMQARLREGNAFFAVGALHLYGEQGVLSLLEKEGFRVTPMD